jgi:hypothetical protein
MHRDRTGFYMCTTTRIRTESKNNFGYTSRRGHVIEREDKFLSPTVPVIEDPS